MAAAERYYETWGRLWERAALLRARASAGDLELGKLLAREVITPFVYRSTVDPTIAAALTELVHRSRNELSHAPERDLKLGKGGIREAEFFVQSLQLVWGGREPTLRVPGTLPALGRLRSQGFVTDREARGIAEAYLLLRRVEHRIQWASGVQTHLLPTEPEGACAPFARSLGFRNSATRICSTESWNARAETVHETLVHSLTDSSTRHAALPRPVLSSELDGDLIQGSSAQPSNISAAQTWASTSRLHAGATSRRPARRSLDS